MIKSIYSSLISKDKINHHLNLLYNNTHPNVKFLQKLYDPKSNKIKNFINIEQIRNLDSVLYQSSLNNLPKFIVIDSADDLNKSSSNALLKILEEPKKNTYFILISHHVSSLLPTIRSRCIKFNISKPTFDEFNQIINLQIKNVSSDEINFLYYISNASPGIAINIYTDNLHNIYINLINILIQNKVLTKDIINLSEISSKYSIDEFKIFLFILRFILINIIKINYGFDFNNNLSSNLINTLKNSASHISNNICINILEYLNKNENDLFIYNLDKKIFTINIFSSLDKTI